MPARMIVLHAAVALLGSYVFTWGFVALMMAGLPAMGVDFHETETAAMLLAFPVFLVLFLWTFATGRTACNAIGLGGGALCMTAMAWGLQQFLLS